MKRIINVLFPVLMVLLLVSCGGSPESGGKNARFAKIDLYGAVGLVSQKAGSTKGSKAAGPEQQDLYKIDESDGSEEPVVLMDESGNPVLSWGDPTSVSRLNDKYFILTFKKQGTYYPPFLLVSTEEDILICLNHISDYSHSCMELEEMGNLATTEYVSTTDNEYIYWTPPNMASDNMLNGTKLNRFNKETKQIDTLYRVEDKQIYALSVGNVTSGTYSGKDVVMMHTTGNTYSNASSEKIIKVLIDGSVEKTFTNQTSSPNPFVFFINNIFYVVDSGKVWTYSVDGSSLPESMTSYDVANVSSYYRKVVTSGTTGILFGENSSVFYFVNGTNISRIQCDSTIADIQTDGSHYYVCLNGTDSSTIKKYSVLDGTEVATFTINDTTEGFRIKSFFSENPNFIFIGQRNSDSKYVRGELTLGDTVTVTIKSESSEEFNNLTKIDTSTSSL